MTHIRERYKRVGVGREDMAANRALRSQRRNEARRDARIDHFSLRRDMLEVQDDNEDEHVAQEEVKRKDETVAQEAENRKKIEDLEEKVQKRLLELKKWKEEKKRRRLQEKKQAKPAFKVGVVHHKVYSPPITKDPVPFPPARLCRSKIINVPESPPKRVTRATEKRLAIKTLNDKQKRDDLRMKKKVKEKKVLPKVKNQEEAQAFQVPDDFQFKAPSGVTAIPMFGRQVFDTTKNNENFPSSNDTLSSISEFAKGLSSVSDSVFDIKERSMILSTSPSKCSNSISSNLKPSDSSPTKCLSNSMNNSSAEAVSLRFSMDDKDSPPTKKVSTRRSTRIVPKGVENNKNSSVKIRDQQTLENQENINCNIKNLMDCSISDFTRFSQIPPLKRKQSIQIENLQNQSLMEFSPRRSTRHQTVNFPEQSNILKATTENVEAGLDQSLKKLATTENVEAGLDQSLKKLATPKNNILPLNHSDPIDQVIIETNDPVNQSLNMSLPKDVTHEKLPIFFSPYVVASRGKNKVRKEAQRRRFSHVSPQDIPTKETIMQTLNISVEEEERTAQYYKFILDKEIERLNGMCDTWNLVKEESTTPEDIHYEIQAAVGQTQLLINKKFERFRGLVLDCESGKGEMLVTCKDLQGFWDMMYMEIRDCENRFCKLEEKKAKNWIVEETEEEKKAKVPKKKAAVLKKPDAKKKPVAAKSSLRAHILAARKKLETKDSETNVEMMDAPAVEKNDRPHEITKALESDVIPMKITRRSTSTPKSTNKFQFLLNKIQSSQSRKVTTSPLIMMKVSQMCKTPEVHLDDSIIYINSDRTPAKSILKSSKEEPLGSVTKPINKVIFKEQPTEFKEFENNFDINDEMLLDNKQEFKEPIERRLDFENDSFNLSHLEDVDKKKKEQTGKIDDSLITLSPLNKVTNCDFMKTPNILVREESSLISMSPLTLNDQEEKSPVKKKARLKKNISFKKSPIRNLRKISAPGTPMPKSINSSDTNEDLRMEVDDNSRNDDEDHLAKTQQVQSRQLYMNEEGIICERMMPIKTDIPKTSTLKHTNSKAIQRSTPTRQRNLIEVVINSPNMQDSVAKDLEVVTPNTSKIRGRNILEVIIDSPSTSENENIKNPSKKRRTTKSSNLDLNETATIQPIFENNKCTIPTSKSKRHSKYLQENKESDKKETDEDVNDHIKVSRSSSIKRRNSKKYLDPVGSNEQENNKNCIDEGLTPTNIRRRSSRIANRSIQKKRKFEDVE